METTKLKKFAQYARRTLIEQVSNKLNWVLAQESSARRECAEAVKKLEQQIEADGQEQVVEKVAYTWFNRFCALRFMDVNRYSRIGVVSPAEGQFQPEILAEAKSGHVDNGVPEKTRQRVLALLAGEVASQEAEAYRLLVVAACNGWHVSMPFMFERIADYSELLMPDDLLSGDSILAYTREAMTPDLCEDVEVIGWLYQFYIAEKKDEVFAGLKKNKKITPENIPAATQLFTPHWIVRYLVENSLGRLWLLNRPESGLAEKMEYYIKPEQPEADFLRIKQPEEIKICDPACGSGHMLTYAFDLLYAIYEEEGYEPSEIPEKILSHNLYGVEIDQRAGNLAAFALTMKAVSYFRRAKRKRFFRDPVQSNICVLEKVSFSEDELSEYMDFIGRDLFTASLQSTLGQFEEADNFGALIRPDITDVAEVLESLEAKDVSDQLFLNDTHKKVLRVLHQADYLSQKYHVVIANPPYMGGKGMNGDLKSWIGKNYPDVKTDLFSAFIIRNTELALPKGQLGFMSPFVWMFISSYEKLRDVLISQKTITSLVQLEYSGFDGATVPICTFTIENVHRPDFKGGYVRLSDFRGSENQAPKTLEAIKNPDCGWFYRASSSDFKKIPGSPIAYWMSDGLLSIFGDLTLSDHHTSGGRLKTHNDEKYIRYVWEVSLKSGKNNWRKLAHGGEFRRWDGNRLKVVQWTDSSKVDYASYGGLHNKKFWGKVGVTCSKITSSTNSFRIKCYDQEYSSLAPTVFPKNIKSEAYYRSLAILNCSVTQQLLWIINPSMTINVGDLLALPNFTKCRVSDDSVKKLIDSSRTDWDSYETSWDFTCLPLLGDDCREPTLSETYQKLRARWLKMTLEMQRLEEENNRIFIDAYGLQDELTPEVPLKEITLTCNPHYRYRGNKSETELESLLLADTMREFISYAVGCMFGRYALDKPGLILANQGETLADYQQQIPESSYPADANNVIPILNGNWFSDDISERFFQFLRTTFGQDHYHDNLAFIEHALGKEIRNYFLKEFYSDHLKRYKKRPIYWLFSSPKGNFNALIYMHRYRPDTASIVLNDYLREFRTKLASHKDHLEAVSISSNAPPKEKTKALKEIEKLKKIMSELENYEREVLYPLATEQREIDLDDGVKVNYPKLGKALKKIAGVSGK